MDLSRLKVRELDKINRISDRINIVSLMRTKGFAPLNLLADLTPSRLNRVLFFWCIVNIN